MKSFIFSLAILPRCTSVIAQEYPYAVKDTLFYNADTRFVKGQDVVLGPGSLPNGDFKYITTSRNSIAGAGVNVGSKWSGHKFEVKGFREYGSSKRGFTYYLILGGGNIVNYEADIANVIKSAEISMPNAPASPAATISKADEIKKMKELLDAGAITSQEYEAEKKKILAQ